MDTIIYFLAFGCIALVARAKDTVRPRLVVTVLLCGLLTFQFTIFARHLPVEDFSLPLSVAWAFLLVPIAWAIRRSLGIAYLVGATIIGLFQVMAGVVLPVNILGGVILGLVMGYVGTLLLED